MRSTPNPAAAGDYTDPIGHYRRRCDQAHDATRAATARTVEARKALADFEHFANSQPGERLRTLESQSAVSAAKARQAEADLANALSRQRQAEAALSSIFNVSRWFSKEESEKKETARIARTDAAAVATRLIERRDDAIQADQSEQALRKEIERIRHVRPEQLKGTVDIANGELRACEADNRTARDALRRIEQRCGSLIGEHAWLAGERSRRLALIADAESLQHKLSTDRANARQWHQQAQARLGNSSPGSFLHDARREMRGVERDLEKLTRRLAEVVRLADVKIDEIVLDGLNLCYADRRFIGLDALINLAGALADRHAVTVYLDSDARSLMCLNDRAIADRFDRRVRVRVTPTGTKADHLLLEHTQGRPSCFVISNDRFGDYPDMSAVRERRILRHQIADGRVIIPDLQLSIPYR